MDEQEIQEGLRGILESLSYLDENDKAEVESALGVDVLEVERVTSFSDEGVLP